MKKELIIFDLDGTLIDSSADIAWAANRTLVSYGLNERSEADIRDNIGWGVKPLLERLMPGLGPEHITSARERFLEFYWGHLTVGTRVFEGVEETLKRLKGMDKKLAVVTNKPAFFARRLLEELGISVYFDRVAGGDSFQNKKPHPEPLEKVIEGIGIPKDKSAFVGDSAIDCETGKKAGVFTIGVSYGFKAGATIEEIGFDVVIDRFSDLLGIIG
ncbi:MAG: HAD-IA family hydrolase [Deltaproteobacteria bacterium]|nr:HAD-IA family hydrolase [Deltaproteobacteria bacterium]